LAMQLRLVWGSHNAPIASDGRRSQALRNALANL
jgi:hypothetical protein